MKKLGFGIIGCGAISRIHCQALQNIEQASLVAVSDVNEASAKKLAGEYGVDYYVDYNDLLDRDDIDVVNICTPSGMRKDIIVKAAQKGKHILAEKPLEITLDRIDEIGRVCRDNNVILGTIFTYRYKNDSRKLFNAIQSGKLGKLIMGDAYVKWYRPEEYYTQSNWRGTWKLDGGGALMNQSIHVIDLLQWYMGPVDTVFAFADTLLHKQIEVEDTAAAVLRFKNGAIGVIEGSTSVYPGYKTRIEITGDKGTVIIEDGSIKSSDLKNKEDEKSLAKSEEHSGSGGAQNPMDIGHQNHQDLFEEYINAIIEKKPFWIDAEEARKPVEIISAIYESARTGKPVKL
jgi:UDP-N-acetyl-2-amino-2-deoxyglucuronate dehydrogenase